MRQGREEKKKVGEAEVGRGLDGCAEKGFDGRQVQKELVQVGFFSFRENAATVTGTRVGRPREGVRQIPSGLAFCDVSQGTTFFFPKFPATDGCPERGILGTASVSIYTTRVGVHVVCILHVDGSIR